MYFVEKIKKRASISQPCCSVLTEVQFPRELTYFYTVPSGDITKLVTTSKRSSSLADPIPVPAFARN